MAKSNIYVRCPKCGKPSNSLKSYKLMAHMLFLLFGASFDTEKPILCPKCMRKRILYRHFTYNIITANFLWYFMLMPWGIVNLIRTTTKGHSKSVRRLIEESMNNTPAPQSYHDDSQSEPPVYPDFK